MCGPHDAAGVVDAAGEEYTAIKLTGAALTLVGVALAREAPAPVD